MEKVKAPQIDVKNVGDAAIDLRSKNHSNYNGSSLKPPVKDFVEKEFLAPVVVRRPEPTPEKPPKTEIRPHKRDIWRYHYLTQFKTSGNNLETFHYSPRIRQRSFKNPSLFSNDACAKRSTCLTIIDPVYNKPTFL